MTTLVKLGGRVQDDPQLPAALAAFVRARGGNVVIVHGGGDAISRMQRALGLDPRFVGGRRVTTPEDLEVVRMVLSGTINKRLVSALLSHEVDAVGISGEDAGLVVAEVVDAAFGRVGRPTTLDVALLRHLLAGSYVPVVSPLARDASGGYGAALNVNGDDCAAALAAALGADELLLLADVPGVLDAAGRPIGVLPTAAAAALVADGTAVGGMAAKLEAAQLALGGGVALVRIGGLDALRDAERGTRLVADRTPELPPRPMPPRAVVPRPSARQTPPASFLSASA